MSISPPDTTEVIVNGRTLVMRYLRATLRVGAIPVATMSIDEIASMRCPDPEQRRGAKDLIIEAIKNKRRSDFSDGSYVVPTGEPQLIMDARRVIAEGQLTRVWLTAHKDGVVMKKRRPLDTTTAGMICQVWDKAEDKTRAVILKIIAERGSLVALNAMWRAVSK